MSTQFIEVSNRDPAALIHDQAVNWLNHNGRIAVRTAALTVPVTIMRFVLSLLVGSDDPAIASAVAGQNAKILASFVAVDLSTKTSAARVPQGVMQQPHL